MWFHHAQWCPYSKDAGGCKWSNLQKWALVQIHVGSKFVDARTDLQLEKWEMGW